MYGFYRQECNCKNIRPEFERLNVKFLVSIICRSSFPGMIHGKSLISTKQWYNMKMMQTWTNDTIWRGCRREQVFKSRSWITSIRLNMSENNSNWTNCTKNKMGFKSDVITFDFRKVFCVPKFTIVIYMLLRGWVFLNNQATVELVLLNESIHIHISSHSHYKLYGE